MMIASIDRRIFLSTSQRTTLVVIGGSTSINYLIRRYAERIGYSIILMSSSIPAQAVCALLPLAVIFSSAETLESSQSLVAGLANCDIPIVVCSSVMDQLRTRQLGADFCLIHPLGYDNFCETLTSAAVLKGTGRSAHGGEGPNFA
jgi:hypothetical protein